MNSSEVTATLARLAASGDRVQLAWRMGTKTDKMPPMSAEEAMAAVATLENVGGVVTSVSRVEGGLWMA